MTMDQNFLKNTVVSSVVGGGVVGALEYATYNRRLFNSEKLGPGQVTKISQALQNLAEDKVVLESLKSQPEEHSKYINEIYKKCCNESGKLVHDAKKISKERFDVVKESLGKMRIKEALTFAAIFTVGFAAVSLISEAIKNRKNSKK